MESTESIFTRQSKNGVFFSFPTLLLYDSLAKFILGKRITDSGSMHGVRITRDHLVAVTITRLAPRAPQ